MIRLLMNSSSQFSQVMPPLRDCDHLQGGRHAAVILMEYGDYQCPQSGLAYQTIQTLQQQIGEHLCFIFRHFPQSEQHPRSLRAAESAEAAAAQGKFWQMHDRLFAHQDALGDGDLVDYAAQLGLEIPQFLRQMAEHQHLARVQADIETGRSHGVETTPTFFINICYQGTQNLETLLMTLLQLATISNLSSVGASKILRDQQEK